MQNLLSTAKGDVIIRTSRPSDATAYRQLRLQALKDHPTAFGSEYEEALKHPDSYWQDRLNMDDEQEALFLAEHAGRLVGMTGIYRRLSARYRHQAEVWGVYVREDWRGNRIADALIGNCLEWARGKGIIIARLGVEANNLSAIRCYERCGFTTYAIETKAMFHEGKYFDSSRMACSLEPEPGTT